MHAGRGGLYYRVSLGGSHDKRSSVVHYSVVAPQSLPNPLPAYAEQRRVAMVAVESGDVAAMRDETVADLLSDLNEKQAKMPIASITIASFTIIGILTLPLGAVIDSETGRTRVPAMGGKV